MLAGSEQIRGGYNQGMGQFHVGAVTRLGKIFVPLVPLGQQNGRIRGGTVIIPEQFRIGTFTVLGQFHAWLLFFNSKLVGSKFL